MVLQLFVRKSDSICMSGAFLFMHVRLVYHVRLKKCSVGDSYFHLISLITAWLRDQVRILYAYSVVIVCAVELSEVAIASPSSYSNACNTDFIL